MITNMPMCCQQIITYKVLCKQAILLFAIKRMHTRIGIPYQFNKDDH